MKFKGKTTIQLFDAKTGTETDRIVDYNRFTIAVDQLINKMPYAMNSAYAVRTDPNSAQPILPLSKFGLGGILLYPNAINAEQQMADPLYCFDQNPTGYASREPYTGEDMRRGNFNAIESGELDSGKGYRFVYDFTTSQANGSISAVCLTSVDGGKSEFGESAETNYRRNLYSSSGAFKPILCTDDGIYHVVYARDQLEVYFIKLGNNKLGINDEYPLNFTFDDYKGELVHTFEFGSSIRYYYYAGHGNEIVVVYPNSRTGITVYKWNVDTDAETTHSITVSGVYLAYIEDSYCGYDGTNIYVAANTEDSSYDRNIVRVNLATPADTEFIPLGLTSAIGSFHWADGYISGAKFLYFPSKSRSVYLRNSSVPFAISRKGVYNIYRGDQYAVISAGIFAPYLATINNISTVNKTAEKTMKITYDITPVEE